MKALSIRAPWWWFILHGGKDIENRDWPTNFRGTVYLHSSKWWNFGEFEDDWESGSRCYRECGGPPRAFSTTPRQIRDFGGCIVGKVDIVGCANRSTSPWFFGKFGFVLQNPVAFKTPVPCKGALGFFNLSEDVLGAIREQEQVCLDCDHLICICGPNEYDGV